MLVARIKCVNRREKRRMVFGNKETFDFKQKSYHVKPECIYQYSKCFGLLTLSAIDYIQNITQPIDFYKERSIENIGRKNLNTISMVVNNWLLSRLKLFQTLVLVLLVVIVGLTVVGIVLPYINGG